MKPTAHWSFRCQRADVDFPRIVREAQAAAGCDAVVVEVRRQGDDRFLVLASEAFVQRWRAADGLPWYWEHDWISIGPGGRLWPRVDSPPAGVPRLYYSMHGDSAESLVERLRRAESRPLRTTVRVFAADEEAQP